MFTLVFVWHDIPLILCSITERNISKLRIPFNVSILIAAIPVPVIGIPVNSAKANVLNLTPVYPAIIGGLDGFDIATCKSLVCDPHPKQ